MKLLLLLTILCAGIIPSYSQSVPPTSDSSVLKTFKGLPVFFKEEGAQFKGGPKQWRKFLNRTFRYPEEAAKRGIQGSMEILFLVDTNGTISDIQILSGEPILAKEGVRVIELSQGRWIPYTVDGIAVKSYKVRDLTFRLQ